MTMPEHSRRLAAVRQGISLLEVLISIGILTVGLIAALSLIPVGRTYLTKAAVDDRAASLISAAHATLMSMGLNKADALGWTNDSSSQGESELPTGPTWTNNSPDSAEPIPPGSFETTYEKGRIKLVRKVVRVVNSTRGVHRDPNTNAVISIDDEDWFHIPVEAGQTLTLKNLKPNFDYKASLNGRPLRVSQMVGSDPTYSIPVDGVVRIKVVYNGPPESDPGPDPNGFTIEITRPDRVVVIDPLTTTRLDWLLSQSGVPAGERTRLDLRRRFFADFNQETTSGQPRAIRIPRLNWQLLTTPTLTQAVALADRFCRMQDDLEIDDNVLAASGSGKRDEFAPPRPVYARLDNGTALTRQALGRMSWAIVLQPQALGSVADNWASGAIFDVSIVAFQDRVLAPLDWAKRPVVNGEYTLVAWWNEQQGVLTIEVPQPYLLNGEEIYLDDEDIRAFFRTGGWALLAPRVAYDSAPIDNNQRFTWVQFQDVKLAKSAAGVTVTAVPLTPPHEDTLLGTSDGSGVPLVAIVNEGVVGVVTKQMKVE